MDPTHTNPELYKAVFENDRVRVLAYRDRPGDATHRHSHPDSVMVTLSSFRRRVSSGDRSVDVEIGAGEVRWVGAQEHWGENTGDTETVSIFVELKEPRPAAAPGASDAPGTPDAPSAPDAPPTLGPTGP